VIRIEFDTSKVLPHLRDLRRNQIPFAIALTLNGIAAESLRGVKQVVTQRGGYRSERSLRWALGALQFLPVHRATKDKLEAQIGLYPGLRHRTLLLPLRERGGTRTPDWRSPGVGIYGPRVAVPLLRPMDRKLYPVNLGLSARRAIEGGYRVGKRQLKPGDAFERQRSLRGKQRTWVMKTAKGPIVMQRVGSGNTISARRPLFALKSTVPVPKKPFFFDTVRRTVQQRGVEIGNAAIARALGTATR
jgi:hypothetical protein